MSTAGPLKVTADFGADEAITDYREGSYHPARYHSCLRKPG